MRQDTPHVNSVKRQICFWTLCEFAVTPSTGAVSAATPPTTDSRRVNFPTFFSSQIVLRLPIESAAISGGNFGAWRLSEVLAVCLQSVSAPRSEESTIAGSLNRVSVIISPPLVSRWADRRGPSYASVDIEFSPGHYNRPVDNAIQINIDFKLHINVIEYRNENTGATVTDE
jgi:hypothetical protein